MMVLNHIRGYVVDNGLPKQKIIEAVKHSVAREYNIRYTDLLSVKEICEELIKDIIGNIYISNENRKTYINILENYLEQNENINDLNDETANEKYNEKPYDYISTALSLIAGFTTIIGTSLSTFIDNIIITDVIDVIEFTIVNIVIIIIIGIIVILYINKKNKK